MRRRKIKDSLFDGALLILWEPGPIFCKMSAYDRTKVDIISNIPSNKPIQFLPSGTKGIGAIAGECVSAAWDLRGSGLAFSHSSNPRTAPFRGAVA